jgi:hypothetical protein
MITILVTQFQSQGIASSFDPYLSGLLHTSTQRRCLHLATVPSSYTILPPPKVASPDHRLSDKLDFNSNFENKRITSNVTLVGLSSLLKIKTIHPNFDSHSA